MASNDFLGSITQRMQLVQSQSQSTQAKLGAKDAAPLSFREAIDSMMLSAEMFVDHVALEAKPSMLHQDPKSEAESLRARMRAVRVPPPPTKKDAPDTIDAKLVYTVMRIYEEALHLCNTSVRIPDTKVNPKTGEVSVSEERSAIREGHVLLRQIRDTLSKRRAGL